jgi:hypothetical protein
MDCVAPDVVPETGVQDAVTDSVVAEEQSFDWPTRNPARVKKARRQYPEILILSTH